MTTVASSTIRTSTGSSPRPRPRRASDLRKSAGARSSLRACLGSLRNMIDRRPADAAEEAMSEPGIIDIRITDIRQLFNSLDPSPFHERDLDREAEEFIVG